MSRLQTNPLLRRNRSYLFFMRWFWLADRLHSNRSFDSFKVISFKMLFTRYISFWIKGIIFYNIVNVRFFRIWFCLDFCRSCSSLLNIGFYVTKIFLSPLHILRNLFSSLNITVIWITFKVYFAFTWLWHMWVFLLIFVLEMWLYLLFMQFRIVRCWT